jgi:hypothetical protein
MSETKGVVNMMGVPQGTPLDIFTQATAGEVIDSES